MKKGPAFEAMVVDHLRANGWPKAERRVMGGANDRGDVAGLPICLELKNCSRMELGRWMTELRKEMLNDGTTIGAVVHKRAGRGATRVGESYVTMTLDDLVALLEEGRHA